MDHQYYQALSRLPQAPTQKGAPIALTDAEGHPVQVGQRVRTLHFGLCLIKEALAPDQGDGLGASVKVTDIHGSPRTIRLHAAKAAYVPYLSDQAQATYEQMEDDRPTLVPLGG